MIYFKKYNITEFHTFCPHKKDIIKINFGHRIKCFNCKYDINIINKDVFSIKLQTDNFMLYIYKDDIIIYSYGKPDAKFYKKIDIKLNVIDSTTIYNRIE